VREEILVVRPLRKDEFTVFFESKAIEKSWRDLVATRRNQTVEAWEFLTKSPGQPSPLNKRLRHDLEFIIRDGKRFDRWQLKLNASDGARIWYYVSGDSVFIEAVHTAYPNSTK